MFDIFGNGLFDFNNDGETDLFETALAFGMMTDEDEDNDENDLFDDGDFDDTDLDDEF